MDTQLKNIEIVEFTPDRTNEVKRVVMDSLFFVGIPSDPTTASRDEDLDTIHLIYSGRSRFWIALEKDTVIGTVAIEEKNAEVAYLRRMFVLETYHGKGVADQLLDQALSFAKSHDYKVIQLHTHHKMKRAHRFYEKHGFQKIGESHEGSFYQKTL